jgi:hypothetical protein
MEGWKGVYFWGECGKKRQREKKRNEGIKKERERGKTGKIVYK